MPVARVDQIAQGRVWAGSTAKGLGLVDDFGTLDTAVAEAARLAGLKPGKAHPLFIERELNPIEKLIRDAARSEEDPTGTDAWSRIAATPRLLLIQALSDADRLLTGPAMQVRCLECGGYAPRTAQARDQGIMALLTAKLGLD